MFVNHAARVVALKFVYFGPRGAGVSTNCDRIRPDRHAPVRGIVLRERGPDDPFVYDFPGLGMVHGRSVVGYFFDRAPDTLVRGSKLDALLQGADGVLFVADSRAERSAENVAAAQLLLGALAAVPPEAGGRPLVLQLNRRDDPSALPVAHLVDALGLDAIDVVEAVASEGRGVRETIVAALRPLLRALKAHPTLT